MYNLLWAPIAVAAGRELAMSGLPDAPVVADKRRRASRPVRSGSGGCRAAPRGPFARSPSTARRSDLAVAWGTSGGARRPVRRAATLKTSALVAAGLLHPPADPAVQRRRAAHTTDQLRLGAELGRVSRPAWSRFPPTALLSRLSDPSTTKRRNQGQPHLLPLRER